MSQNSNNDEYDESMPVSVSDEKEYSDFSEDDKPK